MDASKQTYYRLVRDDDMLFWLLQSVGWIGISLLTYLSLTVPYEQYELPYLAHCKSYQCEQSHARARVATRLR